MSTFLLTYANSETNRLPTLTKEYNEVHQILQNGIANRDFTVVSSPFTSVENIISLIRTHEENIVLFSFSGHAGRDQLLLEDGGGRAEGIANLLERCANLKLVILNGCSTVGQVKLLLEKRIPIVIATSAPVSDYTATQFAIAFLKELIQNVKPVRESFERAVDAARVIGSINEVEITNRGLGTRPSEIAIWGFYYNENILLDNWQLSAQLNIRQQVRDLVAQAKYKEALNVLRSIDKIKNEAGVISGQLATLEKHERLNMIDFRSSAAERAKIAFSILNIADQV